MNTRQKLVEIEQLRQNKRQGILKRYPDSKSPVRYQWRVHTCMWANFQQGGGLYGLDEDALNKTLKFFRSI